MPTKTTLSTDLHAELTNRNLELIIGSEIENFLDKADVVSLPSWPEFMMHDVVANHNWRALNSKFSDFQFALMEKDSGKWITVGNSIPLYFDEPLETLPDAGWDWAVLSGMESDVPPNLLCALAIQILPEYRSRGLSSIMIRIMREIGQQFGLYQLIAPVRPNKKCDYPLIPMETYINWKKAGEQFDPWLRVHERLGARVLKVCPQAMKISGSIQEWEDWTGLSFQTSAKYIVPGALTSISVNGEKNQAEYIEPNVWMLHNSLETD